MNDVLPPSCLAEGTSSSLRLAVCEGLEPNIGGVRPARSFRTMVLGKHLGFHGEPATVVLQLDCEVYQLVGAKELLCAQHPLAATILAKCNVHCAAAPILVSEGLLVSGLRNGPVDGGGRHHGPGGFHGVHTVQVVFLPGTVQYVRVSGSDNICTYGDLTFTPPDILQTLHMLQSTCER